MEEESVTLREDDEEEEVAATRMASSNMPADKLSTLGSGVHPNRILGHDKALIFNKAANLKSQYPLRYIL